MNSNTETKNTDFATSLTELEKVVAELDSDVPIEKALLLFERGMQLSNECEKFLTAAEQKVEILKQSANGTVSIETFSLNSDTTENTETE